MKKVALVTGASGGLGREIALQLLREDILVAAHHHKTGPEFTGYFGEFRRSVFPVRADLRRKDELQALMQRIGKEFGRLHYVINSAAITRDCSMANYSEEDWDDVMALNLTAPFLITRAALPLMMIAGGGHVINVSSPSGLRGARGQCAYSASKAALIGLTRSLAKELSTHGIRVNAVSPGYMATPMGRANTGAMNRALEESVLHCLASPAEVAGFVCFLLKTSHITGQHFSADSRLI